MLTASCTATFLLRHVPRAPGVPGTVLDVGSGGVGCYHGPGWGGRPGVCSVALCADPVTGGVPVSAGGSQAPPSSWAPRFRGSLRWEYVREAMKGDGSRTRWCLAAAKIFVILNNYARRMLTRVPTYLECIVISQSRPPSRFRENGMEESPETELTRRHLFAFQTFLL